MNIKLLDTFQTKTELFPLIELLENNNIPFIQKSEDAGGKLCNSLTFSDVKIFVSEEDYSKVIDLVNKSLI